MDSTTAQLEGCRVITGIRLLHDGVFEDGIVKLRNTALTINANRIIPVRLSKARTRRCHTPTARKWCAARMPSRSLPMGEVIYLPNMRTPAA